MAKKPRSFGDFNFDVDEVLNKAYGTGEGARESREQESKSAVSSVPPEESERDARKESEVLLTEGPAQEEPVKVPPVRKPRKAPLAEPSGRGPSVNVFIPQGLYSMLTMEKMNVRVREKKSVPYGALLMRAFVFYLKKTDKEAYEEYKRLGYIDE